MSIVKAFTSGFRRASSAPKMVFVLYFVNLLMSIPLAFAFRSVLESGIGESLAPSHLMGGLDYTVWGDFVSAQPGQLSAVFSQIIWVMIVSLLVNTFLAGGILKLVRDPNGPFSASAFFSGCGRYFLRFLRLFVIFAVVLCVVGAIVGLLVGTLEEAITKHALSEITDFWTRIGGAIVFLIPLLILMLMADYARVRVVVEDERSMFSCAARAAKFVLSRLFKTIGLELLVLILGIILLFIYFWLDLTIGMTTTATILLMMVIQQLYMISRSWMKVLSYASEVTLYASLSPAPPETTGNAVHEQGVEPAGA